MRVSIFGLGYVGVVTAACLARDGHDVVGVDVNPEKVAAVAAGVSPIVEPGLEDLLRSGKAAGRIQATGDAAAAVAATDVSLVSVGTPSSDGGGPNLAYVFRVVGEIAAAIGASGRPHTVVVRSTVPPGTLARCAEIMAAEAGGVPVHLAFNPEFLREGSAIADFNAPSYTVIGTADEQAEAAVREMYACVDAPFLVVPAEVAEMVKYVANCWHAAKIGFANEIGRVAKAFGVDGRMVMRIIAQDTKLNVSPAYMVPGFAYGGSCLPKDVRALLHYAQTLHVPMPILSALPASNQAQIDAAYDLVFATRPVRVAVFGLAFKSGTDDLRESPAVPLVKRLLGEGCEVRIYAPDVSRPRLMGQNLEYIRTVIPHFVRLLVEEPVDAAEWADTVVLTHPQREFTEALTAASRVARVVDLAGVFKERPEGFEYDGIAW
jgi:GDP-mannose 6-dehydrogenase